MVKRSADAGQGAACLASTPNAWFAREWAVERAIPWYRNHAAQNGARISRRWRAGPHRACAPATF